MESHIVADLADIPPDASIEVEAGGSKIMLANVGGTIYAVQGRCSHMGGILAQGRLADGVVECPLHHSRFDVRTGKKESGPQLAGAAGRVLGINRLASSRTHDLKTYEVAVDDGKVSVKT